MLFKTGKTRFDAVGVINKMRRDQRETPGRKGVGKGFTILELLITLSTIAIIVLVAVPGSNILLEKYRLKAASSQLFSGLELARAEAHQRSSTVIMCPSSNGHSCRRDGDWSLGWLVYSDGNGNSTVQDIELIRAFEAPNQQVRIKAEGAVESNAAFTTTGLVEEDGAQTGKFQVCLYGSDTAPKIVKIDADGWIRLVPNQDEVCETS